MKKIAIICNTGLTSSTLASQLQHIFKDQYIIEAVGLELALQDHDYDLIFLAPQYGHHANELVTHSNVCVEILPANLYNISHIKELQFMIEQLTEE